MVAGGQQVNGSNADGGQPAVCGSPYFTVSDDGKYIAMDMDCALVSDGQQRRVPIPGTGCSEGLTAVNEHQRSGCWYDYNNEVAYFAPRQISSALDSVCYTLGFNIGSILRYFM